MFNLQLDQLYPKPNKKGWEEKYRYAKAYEQVVSDLVQTLVCWKTEYLELCKKEKEEEKSIEEA